MPYFQPKTFSSGGRIDHAHHQSWGKRALIQTVELEKAVQKAMDMTDEDDTLIVVTADHSSAMVIQGHALRGTNILGMQNSEFWFSSLFLPCCV